MDFLKEFKKEKMLILSNILAMTVTFLILGIFLQILAFTQTSIRQLEKQAQITIFFKNDYPEENILALKSKLEKDDRISEVNYISKERAAEIFLEIVEDEVIKQSITPDTLPASLEIKTLDIDDLPEISKNFETIDGVEDIVYYEDIINRFKTWSNIAYTLGTITLIILFIISYSVIVITLRIGINKRGEEIEILKLVGASDDYVKNPIIYQGVTLGFVSSFIASVILISVSLLINYTNVFSGFVEFAALPNILINLTFYTIIVSIVMVLSGVILGYFGSKSAIKKYLKY